MATKKATREEFARLMGITHQDVTKLVLKGVLSRNADVGTWLVEYGRHMQKIAAGWKSAEGWDLVTERARLASIQAQSIAIDVDKKRAGLMPVPALGEAFAFLNGTIRAKLLALPSRFRSLTPIRTDQYLILENLVREILGELSAERFPPMVRRLAERYFSDLHPASKTNGERVGGPEPGAES